MNESADLWKLSSSKFKDGLEYIKNNRELLTNIDKIKDNKTKDFVKNKVKEQMKIDSSRGIVLNNNSSLAKKLLVHLRLENLSIKIKINLNLIRYCLMIH